MNDSKLLTTLFILEAQSVALLSLYNTSDDFRGILNEDTLKKEIASAHRKLIQECEVHELDPENVSEGVLEFAESYLRAKQEGVPQDATLEVAKRYTFLNLEAVRLTLGLKA